MQVRNYFRIVFFLLFFITFYVSNQVNLEYGYFAGAITLIVGILVSVSFLFFNRDLKKIRSFLRKIMVDIKTMNWGKKNENIYNVVHSFIIIIVAITIIYFYDTIIQKLI